MSGRTSPARLPRSLLTGLAAVLTAAVGLVSLFGYFVYQLRFPPTIPEDVTPSQYLLTADDVSWTSGRWGGARGWWIPGKAGRPAIILATGFQISRSDSLSLAAYLHKRGYHSLIYSARGRSGESSKSPGPLAGAAVEIMLSALDFTLSQAGVDGSRVGVWGVDIGAHAALAASVKRPEVRAVAADCPYDTAAELIRLRLAQESGFGRRWIELGCERAVAWLEGVSPASIRAQLPLAALADRHVLVIEGENRPDLAAYADGVYDRLSGNKRKVRLPVARVRLMSAEQMETYDRLVGAFFSASLNESRRTAGNRTGAGLETR